MRIWLIKLGEPLPDDPGGQRLMRMGMLAQMLHARGHEVVWWTSSQDHAGRRLRATATELRQMAPGYGIWVLHGPFYRRNISVARFRHHRATAAEFARLAPLQPRPDLILCAWPTIEMADKATEFGRRHGVPVVLDVRDIWPEAYLEATPKPFRPAMRALLAPVFRQARRAVGAATAVCGISDTAVDYGLSLADRRRGPLDRTVFISYDDTPPPEENRQQAAAFWDAHGVPADRSLFVAAYVGTMSRRIDQLTLVRAARALPEAERARIRLVLCGKGDRSEELRREAADLPHVLLPGWINHAQIWELLRRSSVGLLPYPTNVEFVRIIPNKVGEYISAGLPIVTCLGGETRALMDQEGFGRHFDFGDAPGLARLLVELADRPDQVAGLADRAQSAYHRRLKAAPVYGGFCDFLEGLAAERGA